MPAVHIRDLPPDVLEALKRRARQNQRSLQGELRRILMKVAEADASLDPLPPLQLKLSQAAPRSSWSREEIYGADGR
jgi:Antitoxin FitA-like, ribbon-helix-helix